MAKKSRTKAGSLPIEPQIELGFQRVKSTYTVQEISQLFGLPERMIRRWTREGMIQPIESTDEISASGEQASEPHYDFRALTVFRKIRELRSSGLTTAQIDSQLSGQMNLFESQQGQLIELPRKISPFEQALMLHDRNDPAAPESYYKAIQAGDYVADAYCNLGILAFESGALPKAADCFTLSLKDDPRHFESHFNLANLYLDAGDLRLAKLHYEIAAEIEPSFSNLHFNLGLVYLQESEISLAAASFRRCLELTEEGEDRGQVERLLDIVEQVSKRRR